MNELRSECRICAVCCSICRMSCLMHESSLIFSANGCNGGCNVHLSVCLLQHVVFQSVKHL